MPVRPCRPGAGSIPALAGECVSVYRAHFLDRVYPRACGGTFTNINLTGEGWGLSPRLRGNDRSSRDPAQINGSIPALAGERICGRRDWLNEGVYPRACGGTVLASFASPSALGLSPRLRGNGPPRSRRVSVPGSIPALAGERKGEGMKSGRESVYPRACGGTLDAASKLGWVWGLSPRLRGNADIPEHVAHARRVYPRACGGTWLQRQAQRPVRGLSPRLRGNASQIAHARPRQRSIPALAGERVPSFWGEAPLRVYPRACGGTRQGVRHYCCHWGLSPRLRGNELCCRVQCA